MPERKTVRRAQAAKRQGKSASSQAGEFVREEIHHVREGKHGARSAKQAIAIGLSKARRAGVDLPAPKKGKTSEETREKAKRDLKKGASASRRISSKPKSASSKRSRATIGALEREPKRAASAAALSKQASASARRRTKQERSAAAKKGARTRKRRAASSKDKS